MIADNSVQEATPRVAPPYRFFELFRMVAVEGMQLVNAAEMVGLSCAEAAYVYDTAAQWIATQPTAIDGLTKEQRLRGAERIAAEQMQHLYQEALAAWRRSQGEETVTQKPMHSAAVTTKRTSNGKVAYLALALRIADRMARLPLAVMPEWHDDGDDDANDEEDGGDGDSSEPGSDSPIDDAPSQAISPPKEDCSAQVADDAATSLATSPAARVTVESLSSYEDQSGVVSSIWPLLDDAAGTVQRPTATQPVCLRLHEPAPLNRHERRRQNRLENRRRK